ncbi:hypothetical protein SARC_02775 [Sphaeroforma arctica JP610]|uniref:Rhodanese domain-containing protein n=1 Tax=Sphaeroforma arctica JP610 TaxID=667725 RepID=A0A0L0G7P8_9EUKA|nr:hypothetical protein SARC_02775 [Sphaeroforma arctica JP610]KNC85020.1 hypothetical protein SARC_02775 [Sphaeroforma arctica JP610]|eukprot:XP_014158922.1 hypothetical protein SARC_02775 [Sphaeroforma arctica JP610]
MCKSKIPANQTKKQQIEFLNRMWTAFLDAKEQKDQERQCVLLLMFIEDSMTLGVQSSPDFKRRLEQAFKRAEVLKDQLKLRYIRLKEETKKAEAECQKEEELARTTTPYAFDLGKSQPMKDTQLSSSGSGSSTSNPNKTARYVQPRDVYGWMESENSVLLLDTRSIRIYKSLHIKTIHNSHSVSVPEEVLTKNNLVLKDIDMNIEDDAKAFWAKRNTYKFVVMFDQNTSQDSSTAWHSNFPRLDRILREDGVSDIYIMNGGFREWYKLYPTQCDGTNPTMAPVTNRDAAKIDYPTVGTLNQLSMSVPAHSAKSAHLYPMFGTGTRPISEYETDTDESSDEETPAAVGVSAPAVIRTSKPSLQGPPLLPKPTTPKVSAPPIPVSAKPITAPATVVAKKPRRLKTKKIGMVLALGILTNSRVRVFVLYGLT